MVSKNLEAVRERIRKAAEKAGRDGRDITLVCVTKAATVSQIEDALEAGVTDIGESYIKAAEEKLNTIGHRAKWHLIGHLQTNKAKEAVKIFDLIHSVDSLKLAEEISRRALASDQKKKVLIEVKTSQEATKYGISPEGVLPLLERVSDLPGVEVEGLMTIAPFSDDAEDSRPYFRNLRELSAEISGRNIKNITMRYLSMGMTQDFEVAIEEGANIVRIGRAIFD